MKCPNCGYRNDDDETFCANCRGELKVYQRGIIDQKQCPKCGEMNKADAGSCSSCGTKIESIFTSPESEPVASLPPQPTSTLPEASLALRCPKCQGPMKPGIILVPNKGFLTGVRWDTVDGVDWWGSKGEMLIPGDILLASIRVPGFRCATCKMVVFPY